MQIRRRVLVFDVNETMLDVEALVPHCVEGFGTPDAVREWFTLDPDLRARILTGLQSLPAHADVRPALESLRSHGFRLVTLTNSAPGAVARQLSSSGLSDYFERSFSVDAVQRFKPAPEPYQLVAKELGIATGDLRLVAAHAWDVAGALRAGCLAAFVARSGKVLYPLAPMPDIVGADCLSVARAIIERDGG